MYLIFLFFPSFLLAASCKGEQQSKLFVLLQNPFVSHLKGFVRKTGFSFGSCNYCLHTLNSKLLLKMWMQKCLLENY